MKMLLLSEENTAKSVAATMSHYFKNVDAEVFTFENSNYYNAVKNLEKTLSENGDKQILILVDVYGSTAYIEACIALEKYNLQDNALIICGMSVPMAVKLHNVKEMVDISYIKMVYESHNRLGYELPIRKIG